MSAFLDTASWPSFRVFWPSATRLPATLPGAAGSWRIERPLWPVTFAWSSARVLVRYFAVVAQRQGSPLEASCASARRRDFLVVVVGRLAWGGKNCAWIISIALAGLVPVVGNLTFGIAQFGLLHFDQGWDIALVIGLLGLAWGAFFIRRGSVVVSVANHAGFNAAQVLQQILVTSLGLGK